MEIANSIWYRNDFPFDQSFLDAGANYFGATIKPLNFNDASGSLTAINSWVNDQTHGKIPTILESIKPSDVMYLINAIYFKGSWRTRFDAAQTIAAPFHASVGDQPAHLMHRHGTMSYIATPAYQAVDLAVRRLGVHDDRGAAGPVDDRRGAGELARCRRVAGVDRATAPQ